MCIKCMPDARRGQKAFDLSELELQAVISHHAGVGN